MFPRSIFKTGDTGAVQLMYRTGPSEDYGQSLKYSLWNILIPCSLTCCFSERLAASTYVEIYENRLEYNYPISFCCSVFDRNGTVFFDSSLLQESSQATSCMPLCTHNKCFPDGLSSSETAIFYGDFSLLNSPQLSCVPRQWICCLGPCCVRHSITLDGLSSAKEVMDAVEYCRKTRLKDGPPVVNKAPIGFSAPEPSSTFHYLKNCVSATTGAAVFTKMPIHEELYTMNSLRDQIVQNVKRYDRSSIYGNYGNRQAVFDVIFKALHEALPQMEFYEIIHSIGEHASMMQASTSSRGETPHCPLDTPPGLEGVRSLAWPLQSMNALIETDEFKKEFPFIAPIQIDRCKIEENQQKLMIKPVKIFYYVRFQQQSSSSFKLTNNMIRTRKASQLNEDDPGSVEEVVRVQVCLTPNSKEDEEGVIQEERGETPSRPLPLRELFDQVSIFRKRWMQISKSNQKSNSSRPRKKQITMNAREEMKPISESSKGRGLVRIDQLPNGFTGSRGKKYLSILFRTHSNGAQEIGWTLFHSFTNDFDSSHLILEKGVAATEVDIDDFKFGTTLLVQSSSSIKEILSSTLNQSWQGPIVTSGCDMLRTVLEKFMEIPFHHFTLFDIRHEFISYQKMKQEHLLAQQVTTLLPSLLEILESLGICGDLPMNAGNMSRYILMAFMKIRNL